MFEQLLESDRVTLAKLWNDFADAPDAGTARPVTDQLRRLGQMASRGPDDVKLAFTDIVRTLAAASAEVRGRMFPLLAARLGNDFTRLLLQTAAEVSVALIVQAPPGSAQPSGSTTASRLLDDVSDSSSLAYMQGLAALASVASSKRPYSGMRREQLAAMVTDTAQAHIVEQIGFRAAKSQRAETQGLSASNDYAVSYWRSNFGDTLDAFTKKIDSVKLIKGNDVLVSNPRVLRKLEIAVDRTVLAGLTIKPIAGRLGISVLSGIAAFPNVQWSQILHELGATPSAYQMYELMDQHKQVPESNFEVDTWADLMALITSTVFFALGKIARGQGEAAPVCAMVEHLILGLADQGLKRRDPLTANALVSLRQLIGIAVASERNSSAVMRAVDLMMDEIGIALAVAGDYFHDDYEGTMRRNLLERAPCIRELILDEKKIKINSVLQTSGMDALGTALWTALSSRGHDKVTLSRPTKAVDYYEVGLLLEKLKQGKQASPVQDVLVAALNPSTPFDTPDAGALVARVLAAMKNRRVDDPPFALILDTTIEVAADSTGGAQLNTVLDGLKEAVADGQLEIFLCKSFQKYASLGIGKVAAGDLTLLTKTGNPDSAFARSEVLLQEIALSLTRKDEGQLVIHMLKYAHRDELALIRSAAANTKFVNEFCWPINWADQAQGSNYVDGIPLLLRAARFSDPTIDKLLEKSALIDRRDSFSFLRTSYVGGIPGTETVTGPFVRINAGHESKRAMTEYFYALGHIVTGTLPGQPTSQALNTNPPSIQQVKDHLDALAKVPATDTTGIEDYRQNINASYCLFASQHVTPAAAARPLLVRCFGQPVDKVTVETTRYLARRLFELLTLPSASLPSDPGDLDAICAAANTLPDWEFAVFKEKLQPKLDPSAVSESANRLKALVG